MSNPLDKIADSIGPIGSLAKSARLAMLLNPYVLGFVIIALSIILVSIVIIGIYTVPIRRFLIDYFGFHYDELDDMKGVNGLKRIIRGWDMSITGGKMRSMLDGKNNRDSKDRDAATSTNFARLWEVVILFFICILALQQANVPLPDIFLHIGIRFFWVIVIYNLVYNSLFRTIVIKEDEKSEFKKLVKELADKEEELRIAMEAVTPQADATINKLKKEYKALKKRYTSQYNKFVSYKIRPFFENLLSKKLTDRNKLSMLSTFSGWIASLLGQVVFALCLSKDRSPIAWAVSLPLVLVYAIAPMMDLQRGMTSGLFESDQKESMIYNFVSKYHLNSPMTIFNANSVNMKAQLNKTLSSKLVAEMYAVSFGLILFSLHLFNSFFTPNYRIWHRILDNYSLSAILFILIPTTFAWSDSTDKLSEAIKAGIKDSEMQQEVASQGYNIGYLKGIICVLLFQSLFLGKKMSASQITSASVQPSIMKMEKMSNQQKITTMFNSRKSFRGGRRRR